MAEQAVAAARRPSRRLAAVVRPLVTLLFVGLPVVDVAGAAEPLRVELTTGDGDTVAGTLAAIDRAEVRLTDSPPGSGAAVTVPVERIRGLLRGNTGPAGDPPRLTATLADGATLTGDDIAWDGGAAIAILRPEGRIEIPAARVRSVAWAAGEAAAGGWMEQVPEGTQSDLVVVGTPAGHEFVECAITAVSADAVTVLLDDEKIPVKRAKVIGLVWLRPAEAAGGGRLLVAVRGGRLRADDIAWSPAGLVIDGGIRLPADTFMGIDYAAGRRVSLADLPAERTDVEPWFGSLARTEGLRTFFAPRTVRSGAGGGAGPATLVLRPRSVVVWRLPGESRRLRGLLAPHAGSQAADAAEVVVTADDREVFRGRVDAAALVASGDSADPGAPRRRGGIPLDLDVAGARRLTVTVDFVAGGGLGGAVRLVDPVIER